MIKVLLVEDDNDLRSLLRFDLESSGYKVEEAENGKVGLEKIAELIPDVVVTDLFMPEKDGLETIKLMRRSYPRIKIIAMTGVDLHYLKAAEYMGADPVILKPFEDTDLTKMIQTVLQKQ